jgi:hypothetical protein
MEDDSLLHDVIKQLRVHGLAFVNNIPGLESSLVTIATRMGPIKDTFYGQTWDGESTVFRSSGFPFGKKPNTDVSQFEPSPKLSMLRTPRAI